MDTIILILAISAALLATVSGILLLWEYRRAPVHWLYRLYAVQQARAWWERRTAKPERAAWREVVVVLRDAMGRPLVRFYTAGRRTCYGAEPFYVLQGEGGAGPAARALDTGIVADALVLMEAAEDYDYAGVQPFTKFIRFDEVVRGECVYMVAGTALTRQWRAPAIVPYDQSR